MRKVQADCAIDLDTNSYSVPWRLIGESVQVVVLGGRVILRHAGEVVADHALCRGRRQRIVERAHLAGVIGAAAPVQSSDIAVITKLPPPVPHIRLVATERKVQRDHEMLVAMLDRLKLTAIRDQFFFLSCSVPGLLKRIVPLLANLGWEHSASCRWKPAW
ncbi:hypothetical protein X756_24330 [Mesorhizobium sp. LSHC412B00]|nr:hypothetical protein X756_24330 [Mesorhizobium sp. LSHC412B00]